MRAQGEADHIWPERLPGRRAVLFTITAVTGGLDAAQVAVLDLQTGKYTVLFRGGSHAHYVPSGHLVYASAGTLRAVPFDLTRLKTYGTPVPIERNVVTTANGAVDAVVADDGTLAYVCGRRRGAGDAHARMGGPEGKRDADHRRRRARIPIRGCHLMARASRCSQPIRSWTSGWLICVARAFTSVTSSPGVDSFPVWTPDGQRLIFSSQRTDAGNLFWQDGGRCRPSRATQPRKSQHAACRRP